MSTEYPVKITKGQARFLIRLLWREDQYLLTRASRNSDRKPTYWFASHSLDRLIARLRKIDNCHE